MLIDLQDQYRENDLFQKAIYRFNTVPSSFTMEIKKNDPKIQLKPQKTTDSQNNPGEKE